MDLSILNETLFLGNTVTQWAIALGVGLATAGLLGLLLSLLQRRFKKLVERTESGVDDLLLDLTERTRLLFVVIVSLWVGARTLVLPEGPRDLLRAVLVVGVFVQVGIWANALILYGLRQYKQRQLEEDPGVATATGILGLIARVAVWSVLALMALDNLGIDVTPFIASLGIGGVAIALALQNVLGDLFASLSIVLDKPFVIGDFIIVGDLMGTVEHVGLKTTRVRSLSGEQLVFANSDLLGSRIRNYKRMNERRAVFSVGVTYDTPKAKLEKIPEIIREAVEARDDTRFDRSHFKDFGASSLNFETVYFMLVPDYNVYMDAQQSINLTLFERFAEEGIEFAFPTRTVHLAGGEPEHEPAPPRD